MRVCMLLRNTFTRDARVLREARSLARAGHDVTVVALRHEGLAEREERDGFVVRRAVRAGALAGPTIIGKTPRRARRRAPRPPSPLMIARDRILASRMTRAALSIPADVYHAHDLTTLSSAIEAGHARDGRIVYDAHDLWPDLTGLRHGERVRWRRLERRLIHQAHAVIVPSPSRGEELVRHYGIEMPKVVMNCPPAPSTPPDPADSWLATLRRERETLLVYAGGYTPNRGLENVIRAIDLLDGFRLVMLGWGWLESDLRALASDRVVFADPVAPDAVVSLVAGADIGLVPYLPIGRNNELAAPNKLYEYLHAGLAIAGSDLPDIRRVVDGHGTGRVFDAAKPESIATAVRQILPKLDEYKKASRDVRTIYSWESQESTLIEMYSALDGRGPVR